MSEPTYLTIAEAAERARVSKNTLERWYRGGGLPHVRIGNVVRIRVAERLDGRFHRHPRRRPG